jgi:hypothetical protein
MSNFCTFEGKQHKYSNVFLRNMLTFCLQGQIEVLFGHDIIQQCIKAVGYSRGLNLSIGAEWERLSATPADVFGYVGNFVSSLLC